MDYMIAAWSLGSLLICRAVIGMFRGYADKAGVRVVVRILAA